MVPRLALQKAVEICLTAETFTAMVKQLKPVSFLPADLALFLTLARNRCGFSEPIWAGIIRQFRREADRSIFGVMNAVTATARDTADPHQRWDLEALGGAVPALLIRPPTSGGGKAALAEPHTLSERFFG